MCAFSLTDFVSHCLIYVDVLRQVQGIRITYTRSSQHALLSSRDSDTSQPSDWEQQILMFLSIHFIREESSCREKEDPYWQVCWGEEFGS